MGHGSGGSNVVPTMITQSVSGDTHAASLTGSDTHAAALTGSAGSDTHAITSSNSVQAAGSAATANLPASLTTRDSTTGAETSMTVTAGITPASATNTTISVLSGFLEKITNTGTITMRIRRTNVAGAILATLTTASMVALEVLGFMLTIVLSNEAVSSNQYCGTIACSTSGAQCFGTLHQSFVDALSGSAGSDTHAASLTGTDTHAASLTGSSGSCV